MRNKISSSEAIAIGAQMRAARMRAKLSILELGKSAGVHHSQISRCERGEFKTASKNVQLLCGLLNVSHPKLLPARPADQTLRERFDALLKTLPGSAVAFATLFDVMEAMLTERSAGRKSING